MALDTKFSFLNSQVGPCARKGHHIEWTPPHRDHTTGPTAAGPTRSSSLPGLNIPAGYSQVLGNRLGLANYQNLSSKYHARRDVGPPCRAPRQMAPERKMKVELTWQAPARMKPETMPPAGGHVKHICGKRMIEENTNNLSNVDTLIWGRDVDGSMGCRAQAESPIFIGRAGVNAKWEREPAWGQLPPVCIRTFGEDAERDGWEAVHYDRLDPHSAEFLEDCHME